MTNEFFCVGDEVSTNKLIIKMGKTSHQMNSFLLCEFWFCLKELGIVSCFKWFLIFLSLDANNNQWFSSCVLIAATSSCANTNNRSFFNWENGVVNLIFTCSFAAVEQGYENDRHHRKKLISNG